jgi:pyridoxal phosphate phosphatase PHOSPHO2
MRERSPTAARDWLLAENARRRKRARSGARLHLRPPRRALSPRAFSLFPLWPCHPMALSLTPRVFFAYRASAKANRRNNPTTTCRPLLRANAMDRTPSTLVLFDFDHTVCDGNTDTWILRALPPLASAQDAAAAAATSSPRARVLPPSLRNPRDPHGWTAYMQSVFDYAHERGVFAPDFKEALRSLPLTPGFHALLTALLENVGGDSSSGSPPPAVAAGIVSDSNDLFIPWTLEANGFDSAAVARLFARGGVHSNPAALCEEGRRLTLTPHETRPHGCALSCPPNMCKGKRVKSIRAAQGREGEGLRVAYVGDGGNDLCAAAALSRGDVVFARRGMALDRLLQQQQKGGAEVVRAEVVRWETGDDVRDWLRSNWGVLR